MQSAATGNTISKKHFSHNYLTIKPQRQQLIWIILLLTNYLSLSPTPSTLHSSNKGLASDPHRSQRQGAWGAVLGTAVAVAFVGLVAYIILKKKNQKGFSHRKLVEEYPSDPGMLAPTVNAELYWHFKVTFHPMTYVITLLSVIAWSGFN